MDLYDALDRILEIANSLNSLVEDIQSQLEDEAATAEAEQLTTSNI